MDNRILWRNSSSWKQVEKYFQQFYYRSKISKQDKDLEEVWCDREMPWTDQ